jgi:hypothetical protein
MSGRIGGFWESGSYPVESKGLGYSQRVGSRLGVPHSHVTPRALGVVKRFIFIYLNLLLPNPPDDSARVTADFAALA